MRCRLMCTLRAIALWGRSRPKYPWREGQEQTPVTCKMGCMSAPDIHEQRLETLRKQAVERLRDRRACRRLNCGIRSFQRGRVGHGRLGAHSVPKGMDRLGEFGMAAHAEAVAPDIHDVASVE